VIHFCGFNSQTHAIPACAALQDLYERTDHTVMHRYMARAAMPGSGGGPRSYSVSGHGRGCGGSPVRASSPGFELH